MWRVEVGGILVEVLELFALVVVKGILSKECVSPRLSNKGAAASKVGCRTSARGGRGGQGEKRVQRAASSTSTLRNNTMWHAEDTHWRRRVVEVIRAGGVGVRGRQRRDAQRELMEGRLSRRPRKVRSVRIIHL